MKKKQIQRKKTNNKKILKQEKIKHQIQINKKKTKQNLKNQPKITLQKHGKVKKDGKKKNNKALIIGVIAIVLILIILAIVLFFQNTPKVALEGMLNSLKTGDFEKASQYVDINALLDSSKLEENDQDKQKLLFDKLSWKINKVTEENNNATVEVEITTKDFKVIIENCMQKALKAVFSGQDFSNEQLENMLVEELSNEQVQTTTLNSTINLTKQDGKWKVVSDDTLVSALLPGLNEAIEEIQ